MSHYMNDLLIIKQQDKLGLARQYFLLACWRIEASIVAAYLCNSCLCHGLELGHLSWAVNFAKWPNGRSAQLRR